MIQRGVYRVVQRLNISHSLLSQTEAEPGDSKNSIHKALLERGSAHTVVYFADQASFGPDTEIDILHDLKHPILFSDDYRVTRRTPGAHSTRLVQKLLSGTRHSTNTSGW